MLSLKYCESSFHLFKLRRYNRLAFLGRQPFVGNGVMSSMRVIPNPCATIYCAITGLPLPRPLNRSTMFLAPNLYAWPAAFAAAWAANSVSDRICPLWNWPEELLHITSPFIFENTTCALFIVTVQVANESGRTTCLISRCPPDLNAAEILLEAILNNSLELLDVGY